MKKLNKTMVLGMLIAIPGLLIAQPPVNRPGPPPFSAFDLNGDGVLVQAEFDQVRAQRISQRASQGYLMRNLPNAPTFSAIDSDGNGQVTPEELSAAQLRHRRQRVQRP
ncbi:MAG: hypothetical protein KZQ88_13260 [Candidatus Thiodiazotropha sp. (ex Dulcina madagascariensis)]|nr:hypothetical protein [Candidatus Thiodiazotropha sp. (ex Dulcina madagascariensis)]MCU7926296.1 hypothetical protein [Candidatus Thiodiazotropha sp. (ex Dulcina madagascariensis)]